MEGVWVSFGSALCKEVSLLRRTRIAVISTLRAAHAVSSATLVDDVSSGAIVSVSPHGGVSVSMSMTYLSPTPGNQDCEIDARVIKSGRTLAFAEVEIRHKKTGKVTARGTHIKFIPQTTVQGSGDGSVPKPVGTPDKANSAEAATAFIDGMCSETLEGFDAEATHSFDTTALYGLKCITATAGQVICTLPVSQRTQNRYNTLHGGCTGRTQDPSVNTGCCVAAATGAAAALATRTAVCSLQMILLLSDLGILSMVCASKAAYMQHQICISVSINDIILLALDVLIYDC